MLGASPRILLALLAFVSFLGSCQSLRQQDVQTLFLPNRETWVCAYAHDDGHATIVEYVPQGQTLEH